MQKYNKPPPLRAPPAGALKSTIFCIVIFNKYNSFFNFQILTLVQRLASLDCKFENDSKLNFKLKIRLFIAINQN